MLRGILLVFLGASSFGVLSTFVKLAYKEGYSLGDVTGIQAFWGMMTLWILYFTTKGRLFKDGYLDRKQMWQVFLMGASTGLVSLFYYQCVKLIPASIAILLLMQFTWISMLLEYLFFKKKPALVQFIAVIVILFGTLLAGNFFRFRKIRNRYHGCFLWYVSGFLLRYLLASKWTNRQCTQSAA
ncbi:DMT family transporter [Penaeicola halotolerans]|uniref:DMT family transporter n=1 Tax=Penaeicola halotolerans TaxID=2793196 RepID=UPI001CF819DA|nr:DMT family transporter [Penaeicola halotolerans]